MTSSRTARRRLAEQVAADATQAITSEDFAAWRAELLAAARLDARLTAEQVVDSVIGIRAALAQRLAAGCVSNDDAKAIDRLAGRLLNLLAALGIQPGAEPKPPL